MKKHRFNFMKTTNERSSVLSKSKAKVSRNLSVTNQKKKKRHFTHKKISKNIFGWVCNKAVYANAGAMELLHQISEVLQIDRSIQ